jgi:hypothetical protein
MGGRLKVKGIRRAQPMVAVRPGREPRIIPAVTPMVTNSRLTGLVSIDSKAVIKCIKLSTF